MNAVTMLAAMLADRVPELHGAIVLVDSPRWPVDLDSSQSGVAGRIPVPGGRDLDVGLRAIVYILRTMGANYTPALSMFPTPSFRYFGAHLNAAACKPHLRMLGQALFGDALNRDYGPPFGGIFTRFMIAGFATYQALEAIGAKAYECYPDFQFRLWRRKRQLFPKKSGRVAALRSRVGVLSALARRLGVVGSRQVQRLDEADAAILAMSVIAAGQYGVIFVLRNSHEGRFMVALDEPEALSFNRRCAGRAAHRSNLACK
jgi:hypothetical protein